MSSALVTTRMVHLGHRVLGGLELSQLCLLTWN